MNNAKNKSDIIFYSAIALILLIGMFARAYMWINHFGTCDDLGPIASILSESTDGNILYPQENFSLMQKWKNGIKTIASWHWTYAPLQFILPVFMLDGNQSYQQKIIIGRLPSFLSSILAIILFALFLLKTNSRKNDTSKISILFGLVLLSFSFESILYAGQSENYAITVLGSVVIIFLFSKSKDSFWKWNWFFLASLCYAQWQFFYIVFVFYAVFVINSFLHKNKEELKNILLSGETTLLLNIPNLFLFFRRGMINRGAREWNIGPNMEFLFQPWLYKASINNLLSYVFSFVFGNIIKIYKALFVPVEFLGAFSSVFAIFLMVFTILGIIRLHKNKGTRLFAFFIDGLIFTVALLVIKRKLTLSPSRHMLIYQPFIAMCIIYGICYVVDFFKSEKAQKIVGIVFSCLLTIYTIFFLIELPLQMKIRKNHFSEEHIASVIEKYNPDAIVTVGYTPTMNLFLAELSGYNRYKGDIYKSYLIKESFVPDDKLIVMGYNSLLVGEQAEIICNELFQEAFDKEISSIFPPIEPMISDKTEWLGADQEYIFQKTIYPAGEMINLYSFSSCSFDE